MVGEYGQPREARSDGGGGRRRRRRRRRLRLVVVVVGQPEADDGVHEAEEEVADVGDAADCVDQDEDRDRVR